MKIYITFGQVHTHRVNKITFDRDCVAVINAESYEKGRELAFEYFSNQWYNAYSEEEFSFTEILLYYPRGLIEVNPL